MVQTEYPFTLPVGYQSPDDASLHREGVMRLATAADEVLPLQDTRVQANPAYSVVLVLSRVVTRLGSVAHINPNVIEGLFAADFAYLRDMYCRINQLDASSNCGCCLHGCSFKGHQEFKDEPMRHKKD
jgi:hypothetical protein